MRPNETRRIDRLTLGGLTLTCCALGGYAAWTGGATIPALHPPLLIFGGLSLAFLGCALGTSDRRRLVRDPFFICGALFLTLIAIQTWNTGRLLYFNPIHERWMYTAPPFPYLPWSFNRSESFQMLAWFGPAWALGLALRHGPARSRLANVLLWFVVVNGALLALAGIIQWVRGDPLLFWHTAPGNRFYFATFFYRNHAGSFMALTLAATLGLLAYHIRWRRNACASVNVPVVWALGAVIVLLLVAVHTALSRAGILLAWALILLFMLVQFAGVNHKRDRVGRLQIGVVLTLLAMIALLWGAILGGDALSKRAQSLHSWSNQVQGRYWQWDAAIRIWQDHPVWGVGGWGYRYLLPHYIDESLSHHLRNPGKANAHNDLLQFLAEFGAFGLLLLLAAVSALVFRFMSAWRSVRSTPVSSFYLFTFAGLILVTIHSLMDLPFRNPAILYTFIILLAAIPAGWGHPARRSHSSTAT